MWRCRLRGSRGSSLDVGASERAPTSVGDRVTRRSTKQLEEAMQSWVDTWNDNPHPFTWHKTADQIPDTLVAYCHRISDSGH